MSQSLSQVYIHVVFSTKYRQPIIDEEIEERLFEYIGGICKSLECNPIIVGGHKDHIHILCSLSKKVTQMNLIEEIKKRSSKWIKTDSHAYSNFYWQSGYGAFSINHTDIDVATRYIKNQKERHSKVNFKEELLAFLRKYEIDYDERYLWE